ncbi:hypothetical protein CXF68_20280 [Tenacibaculum sp. Bg11-29]|uniref:hypothetical protein n=1 Tax=Tenacibaculum sp. Bg11-29 TaxID=2058306 RepID=UPI000C33755E|nr:hypothetical protein [Tenacibaculum sp. Bg11-29]PKH52892.1 hypothetical protein CXF68_20280 [Tenacibaculum sp. Bg11-29]
MEIDNLIKKFDLEIEQLGNDKSKLDEKKDAQYWLLLGKSEALGNSIVDIIEEYAKENKLSQFQKKNLKIYKL